MTGKGRSTLLRHESVKAQNPTEFDKILGKLLELRRLKFYGEVTIQLRAGEPHSIGINQTLKPSEL